MGLFGAFVLTRLLTNLIFPLLIWPKGLFYFKMRLFHFCLVKSVLIFYYCSVGNCVEKAIGEQLTKSDSSFTFDDSTLFKINFVDTTSENNNSNEDIRVKKFEVC